MLKITSSRLPGYLVPALFLLAPGLRAEAGAPPPRSSLEVFEALYAQVETAVAEGRLPADIGVAAEDVAFALRKERIRSDAEIEVLRLEAVRFDGERQQRTLDQLIAAAAARERQVTDHLRRLEELAVAPTVEGAILKSEDREKKGLLGISFEPADPIEDPGS